MRFRTIRRLSAAFAVTALGAAATAAPAAAQSSFPDVPPESFYGPAVEWLEQQDITDGIGDTGEYRPLEPVSRAQLATFMWRMAGEPTGNPDHGFTDVPEGSFYDEAVKWIKDQGITTGIDGSDEFKPLDPVLRNQAFTFLWRYGGEPAGYPPHGFEDVPAGSFYELPVRWAVAEGITTGIGGSPGNPSTVFAPLEDLNRAQMAALIWRYAGLPAPDEPGNTQPGAWVPGEPAQPGITDVATLDSGAHDQWSTFVLTYSDPIVCDDRVEVAAQFQLLRDGEDRTGFAIDCDGNEATVTFEEGFARTAEFIAYEPGAAGDRVASTQGVDAAAESVAVDADDLTAPGIDEAALLDAGAIDEPGAVTVTYDEPVTCDDSAAAAAQFTLLRADGRDDLAGEAIDCSGALTAVVTFEDGVITPGDEVSYDNGPVVDARIQSSDDLRAALEETETVVAA